MLRTRSARRRGVRRAVLATAAVLAVAGCSTGQPYVLVTGAPEPAGVATVAPAAATPVVTGPGTAGHPFAATSDVNAPVAARAAVDPAGAAFVRHVTSTPAVAALVDSAVPVLAVDESTSRVAVHCLEVSWGACPFPAAGVPLPASATLDGDGSLVLLDAGLGRSYELWRARREDGAVLAHWGAVNQLDGSGWGGNATGSGASRLAGLVRVSDVASGTIPHALAVTTDDACAGVVRAPATKTDGDSTRADCVPEGTRLQLDPSVDVDALDGATPGEAMVARALRTYGAYVVGRGSAPLAVVFERAPDASPAGPGAVYSGAGLEWDYELMPHVPWSRLRVLRG